jgi:mRNA-degrading endonuclease HigB of HigAB toxin-antitoxin module
MAHELGVNFCVQTIESNELIRRGSLKSRVSQQSFEFTRTDGYQFEIGCPQNALRFIVLQAFDFGMMFIEFCTSLCTATYIYLDLLAMPL